MASRLNLKQEAFVRAYLRLQNATAAAIEAGYASGGKREDAHQAGWRLMRRPAVREAIAKALTKHFKNNDLSAERVLEELRRVAFSDLRSLYDEHGNLRSIKDWTAEQSSAIAECTVLMGNADKGDGKRDQVLKVRFWDKAKALEMLAKHFELMVEKRELTGAITVSWLPAEKGPVVEAVQGEPPSPALKALSGSQIPVSVDNDEAKQPAIVEEMNE